MPHDEIDIERNANLENILFTPDDRNIGHFVEVISSYPDKIEERSKIFPLAPQTKKLILKLLHHICMKWNQTLSHKLSNYCVIGAIKRSSWFSRGC